MSTRHVKISTRRLNGYWSAMKPGFSGRRLMRLDSTDGDIAKAYLPPHSIGGELTILKAVAANTVTVFASQTAKFQGSDAGSFVFDNIGDAIQLFSDGNSWYPNNPTTIIT